MAVDSSFDYDRLLSLDQAKLVGRERLNSLGSYELTLNYNKISSATKEDCLEYLEANRLSVTNPTFSNKTYEGIWKCVSIAYDENKSIIQQIFKVDSSVGDLGDWDGEGAEPTWANQEGDISHISSGMKAEKAYYWKVTNPEDVNLPTTAIAGEVWTKTANDNGDGTYDVVVSKQTSENQTGNSEVQTWGEGEASEVTELTDILISGGTLTGVNQYYEHTAGTIGDTDAVWTGRTDSSWQVLSAFSSDFVNSSLNRNGNYWRINSSTYGEEAYHPYEELNAGDWFTGATSSTPAADYYRHELIIQIGFNEKAMETTSDVNTSSSLVEFGSGVGEEPYPTSGQEKSISNVPLENGEYKTTVTTTTVNEQRVPALTGSIPFANNSSGIGVQIKNYDGDRGAMVIGKNATYESFQSAVNEMNKFRGTSQNSVSFTINKYGLYDYTLRSADI